MSVQACEHVLKYKRNRDSEIEQAETLLYNNKVYNLLCNINPVKVSVKIYSNEHSLGFYGIP